MHGFSALTRGLGRPVSLILAAALMLPVATAPVAAAGGPGTHADFARGVTRSAKASRISGRDAAIATREHPRKTSAGRSALARPDGIARGTAGSTATRSSDVRSPRVVAGPGLVSTHRFDGIDQVTVGYEPPDPWVAVNATNIVQTTNGLVRVSTRAGQELASIATWSLFVVPAGYGDSDPRIIWDAYHGRWVGVLIYFDDPTFSDNHLVVAVSDGSNPLGSWTSFDFAYGNTLPDYPGIVSSSDKIAATANEYVDGSSYAGSSVLTMPWSAILQGTDLSATHAIESTAWNLRPGRITGTAADIWFVYESGDTGYLKTLRISGSGTSPTYAVADVAIPNGNGLANAPRQPGDADGIAQADDGRIPDAVWRSNKLWFARTVPYAFNGTDDDLAVEVVSLTTSTTVAPVVALDVVWGGPSGTDSFSPGVGMSGSGTAFVAWCSSSATEPPSVRAIAYPPTAGAQGPIEVATSDGSYTGARWGDFAGLATDPSGTDTVWQTHETVTADGTWRTEVSRLVFDQTYPTATAPKQALIKGTSISQYRAYPATVPVKVTWTGADPGSGITRYWLEQNDHGSGFGLAATTTSASYINQHTWKPAGSSVNSSWQYRVTPQDDGGNSGTSATGSLLTPTGYQQSTSSFTYSSGWTSSSNARYSGGSVKYSSKTGASASFRTSGRSFGFVTTRSSTRGKVKVYVDGSYKGTITLKSSTTKYRYIAYAITFTSTATHTVKLVVASGRVDVDAFMVLK